MNSENPIQNMTRAIHKERTWIRMFEKEYHNGRVYNTATAKMIGDYEEYKYYAPSYEALYKKRNGEYFLYVPNNNLFFSEYGGYCNIDNCCCMPLTYSEASEWAIQYMSADAYMAEFGEVEE